MTERYVPPSDFLVRAIDEEVAFDCSEFGAANLQRLIALTRDANEINRDWAVLLLGWVDDDTAIISDALRLAADDRSGVVRAEAISGLARRSHIEAVPLIIRELQGEGVWLALIDAAQEVADPALVEHLMPFSDGDDSFAEAVRCAISACAAGVPRT